MNELLKFAAGCALGYATVYVLKNGLKLGSFTTSVLNPGNPGKDHVTTVPPQFPIPQVA